VEERERTTVRRYSRREAIVLGVGAFVVAAVPFIRSRRAQLVRRTVPVMGTIAEISVVHGKERYAHAAIEAAIGELRLVERLLTRFTESSEVGRANRLAFREGVAVGKLTATVIEEALGWAESSDGAFDPCLGRIVELWDFERRHTPPAEGDRIRLAGRRLYRALDLDRSRGGGRVRFTEQEVALDLGGIGKGYGVDRAVARLREWGLDRGLVNVGGDLYALGTSEDGDPWKIGIRSPSDPSRLAGRLELSDGAVATSGDYLRFFRHDDNRYHHLLDPATGAPREPAERSVTVRAPACMTADAAATAVFGMAPGPAGQLLRHRAPGAAIVSTP
jgi:FAD:protein FMN transferase